MTSGLARRQWGLLLAVVALMGCTMTNSRESHLTTTLPPIVDPSEKPNLPTLLIAMPHAKDFMDARRGLVTEVQENFNVFTFLVTPNSKPADLEAVVTQRKPVCVVLMNNTTVNLYRQLEMASKGRPVPPAVVVMASFVEEVKSKLKNATGIAYEVPGVTAFVSLRSVVTTPVNRVGVVYRAPFKRFIEKQKVLALKEHVELISEQVPGDVTAHGLKTALQKLVEDVKVDAIWMLNDNGLLRDPVFINESWRTVLSNRKVPLIVGVPNLVDPAASLGTLAVVPDHEALGFQAANLIFDLQDNDWEVASHPVELPLSVKSIVDLKSVRASFGLKPDALRHVDKALE